MASSESTCMESGSGMRVEEEATSSAGALVSDTTADVDAVTAMPRADARCAREDEDLERRGGVSRFMATKFCGNQISGSACGVDERQHRESPTIVRESNHKAADGQREHLRVSVRRMRQYKDDVPLLQSRSFPPRPVDLGRGSHGAHRIRPVRGPGVRRRQIGYHDGHLFVILFRLPSLLDGGQRRGPW